MLVIRFCLIYITVGTEQECMAQESALEESENESIDLQRDLGLEDVDCYINKENSNISLPSPPLT